MYRRRMRQKAVVTIMESLYDETALFESFGRAGILDFIVEAASVNPMAFRFLRFDDRKRTAGDETLNFGGSCVTESFRVIFNDVAKIYDGSSILRGGD